MPGCRDVWDEEEEEEPAIYPSPAPTAAPVQNPGASLFVVVGEVAEETWRMRGREGLVDSSQRLHNHAVNQTPPTMPRRMTVTTRTSVTDGSSELDDDKTGRKSRKEYVRPQLPAVT